MSKFYTYAKTYGNKVLYRGYDNGIQICEKLDFSPTLYLPSTKESDSPWRGLYDNVQLEPMHFPDIKEAKNFIETYKGVEGMDIHGFQRFDYAHINREFPGEIDYDISKVDILTIDIEVISDGSDGDEESFPDIEEADTPIVLISYHSTRTNTTTVLGLKSYIPSEDDDFDYIQHSSEKAMLRAFIAYMQINRPDVITGWNIDHFDIPYIVNRIVKILDEQTAKLLSPFKILREKNIEIRGKKVQTYEIYGLIALDLLECYRKFGSYSKKESYALGYIAEEELGETKAEMPGNSFRDNYNNYFQTMVKYSAIDTILVKKLNNKLKLVELVFAMAFMYKCNLGDVYKTVLPWEVFIFNHLHSKNIAFPPKREGMRGEVEGAWVKEPSSAKMHGWTMSFDFSSLYPSEIIQWNISPETFVPAKYEVNVQKFLEDGDDAKSARSYALETNHTIAANGTMYSKDKKGFLAELMTICMEGRKIAKKEMIRLEQEYERTHDASLLPRISALDNKQMALKIAANSAYGAIGNEGFAFFDYRIAEAITLTGQLCDMHLANSFNTKMNKIIKSENIDYVIYADTDSIYLDCQKLVHKFATNKSTDELVNFLSKFGEQVCQPIINESVDALFVNMNCKVKVMNSKREAIASKLIFTAKKKYGMYVHDSEGVRYNPPKLKSKGLQLVQSSTPQWCRKKLKDCLMMIFESTEKEFRKKFTEIEEDFKTQPADVVAFPRGISDIDKYVAAKKSKTKTTYPIHVRAAMLYNEHTAKYKIYPEIQNGDRIKFIYMKIPNPIRENVFGFPTGQILPKELKLEEFIDYDTQFLKTFENPLKALTDAAGWKLREVSTLESFLV